MKNVSTMKAGIIMLLLTTASLFSIQSCNKYDDGPFVSLRSRTERVSNTWKVENYKVNNDDLTSLVTDYRETFTKENTYNYTWGLLSGSGTWMFQNNDEEIKISDSNNQTLRTLKLLKLEEKAFWYYYMDGDDKHELHLVPSL